MKGLVSDEYSMNEKLVPTPGGAFCLLGGLAAQHCGAGIGLCLMSPSITLSVCRHKAAD